MGLINDILFYFVLNIMAKCSCKRNVKPTNLQFLTVIFASKMRSRTRGFWRNY